MPRDTQTMDMQTKSSHGKSYAVISQICLPRIKLVSALVLNLNSDQTRRDTFGKSLLLPWVLEAV